MAGAPAEACGAWERAPRTRVRPTMTTMEARCEVCRPLHDRLALGKAAYTASRISGVSAARLTKLESEVKELAMVLTGHRCDVPPRR